MLLQIHQSVLFFAAVPMCLWRCCPDGPWGVSRFLSSALVYPLLGEASPELTTQPSLLHVCCCCCCCCADVGGADALGLENFPFISTGQSNYSPELTKLLSHQANWQVLQLQQQLQQLLQGANVTLKAAT